MTQDQDNPPDRPDDAAEAPADEVFVEHAAGEPDAAAEPPPGAPEAPDEPAETALSDDDLAAIEAVLFTTDAPLSPAKIGELVELPGGRRAVRRAVEQLNERYERTGCSFRIEPLAGGYQMLTLPRFNDVLRKLLKVRNESKLSQAAMETLAIIAYKQPILRADIEAIRGVSSGEMVRSLMEKGLVKIVGRAEEIGRPMLYGTTSRFLEIFGLADLKELPKVDELTAAGRAIARSREPLPEETAEATDAPLAPPGGAAPPSPAEPDEPPPPGE